MKEEEEVDVIENGKRDSKGAYGREERCRDGEEGIVGSAGEKIVLEEAA